MIYVEILIYQKRLPPPVNVRPPDEPPDERLPDEPPDERQLLTYMLLPEDVLLVLYELLKLCPRLLTLPPTAPLAGGIYVFVSSVLIRFCFTCLGSKLPRAVYPSAYLAIVTFSILFSAENMRGAPHEGHLYCFVASSPVRAVSL